jgi:hypothetical protein
MLTITSSLLNEIQKVFYQNDQRKKLYKVWYERKFSEYPYLSFICENKNVHAFLSPHYTSGDESAQNIRV